MVRQRFFAAVRRIYIIIGVDSREERGGSTMAVAVCIGISATATKVQKKAVGLSTYGISFEKVKLI